MSVEKINAALPLNKNLSFKGAEVSDSKEPAADEEKSLSMKKMVGLGALAAITIGGIILYARKGRTPKTSSAVSTAGGGASSTASATASSSASGSGGTPPFEPVKKFMKKLEDGTEYLFRTEERDKDGNLVKTVRYAKDGKTIERVREFKMFPAGMNTPARNVVASEIRYGKDGEVIYKRTAHSDGSGFDLEKFADIDKTIWGKLTYVTHLDGKRFRSVETSGVVTDAKTGRKIMEVQFGPKGEDDMVLIRRFDKKTGTKVVQEMQRLSDDTYKATEFGQGQSRRVFIFKEIPGQEDEILQFERFGSQGRLREFYIEEGEKEIVKKIDKQGRELIIEREPGVEPRVSRTYEKFGEKYQQYLTKDGVDIHRDGKLIGTVRGSGASKEAKITEDNYTHTLTYSADGKKLEKNGIDSLKREYKTTYDRAGNIVKREGLEQDGVRWERRYYQNNRVQSVNVEHNPDGSHEIVIDYRETQVTPEGLHYDFSPIKFDKNGNIIPHSYSNQGKLGDIDEIRSVLYELGEDELLTKYYHPNGQISMF